MKSALRAIEDNFRIIQQNAHPITGLFPAVDCNAAVSESESFDDHMREAWIRDWSMNLIGLIGSATNLRKLSPENTLADEISGFVKENITTVLGFLDKPRWTDLFRQSVVYNEWYTEVKSSPPEVHMQQDGARCEGTQNGPWDQNQPEAWGEFLLAIGKAKEAGIIGEYSSDQTLFIKRVAGYLVRAQPWAFESSGMWEGLPVRTPTSRSVAIAIAKGLDAVSSFLYEDDQSHYAQMAREHINFVVQMSMLFVRQNPDEDYTARNGHTNGVDLAMLAAIMLFDSEKTRLSFTEYVERNKEKLGIGELIGARRYDGDPYKRGELGEARWFMAEPILAIGYFQEAQHALKMGDLEKAKACRAIGEARLKQALAIVKLYRYPPELFTPQNPANITDKRGVIIRNGVALVPLKRSLLWNRALIMLAASEGLLALKPEQDTPKVKSD